MCPDLQVEPRPIISVDTRRLNRILWVNEEDGLAHVEAGITGRELVEQLTLRGLTIGHEPDSYEFSTLGGWIATKASGMKRSKYGNIEDIVKKVFLASSIGRLDQGAASSTELAWGRVSTGMDLESIVLGSEGCLGIVTSAIIRVWRIPESVEYDSVVLSNLDHGMRFARDVSLSGCYQPASCRILDNGHFRLGQALRARPDSVSTQLKTWLTKNLAHWWIPFDKDEVVCATISYEGSKDEVAAQKKAITKLASKHGGVSIGSRLGKEGYQLTFLVAYLRDFALTCNLLGESFETFVSWSRLLDLVSATKKTILDEHRNRLLPGKPFIGSRITQLYHEGACVYFYVCMPTEGVPEPSKALADLEDAARRTILAQGGSLSHHHGVGKVRAPLLLETENKAWIAAQHAVKESLDPLNIFGARNGAFYVPPCTED